MILLSLKGGKKRKKDGASEVWSRGEEKSQPVPAPRKTPRDAIEKVAFVAVLGLAERGRAARYRHEPVRVGR